MTHLGSGVCIAAVETMLICVGRGEQSSFLPRPSQRRIATRSSVNAADSSYAAAKMCPDGLFQPPSRVSASPITMPFS
jgi:hypothetical protein